ncbi:MAG: hypothetical protein CSA97_04420 [Bacteroidetes bacterium]|nr:MAG: hypothetical protein CSA97_04420 [Bacteroidota bacterium]
MNRNSLILVIVGVAILAFGIFTCTVGGGEKGDQAGASEGAAVAAGAAGAAVALSATAPAVSFSNADGVATDTLVFPLKAMVKTDAASELDDSASMACLVFGVDTLFFSPEWKGEGAEWSTTIQAPDSTVEWKMEGARVLIKAVDKTGHGQLESLGYKMPPPPADAPPKSFKVTGEGIIESLASAKGGWLFTNHGAEQCVASKTRFDMANSAPEGWDWEKGMGPDITSATVSIMDRESGEMLTNFGSHILYVDLGEQTVESIQKMDLETVAEKFKDGKHTVPLAAGKCYLTKKGDRYFIIMFRQKGGDDKNSYNISFRYFEWL